MTFKISATRISNLTDARYFAAKEVAFLGFNLEEGSPGYLEPMYMKAIREWVEGPKIVGEFDRTPARTILEAASFYGLDAVQVTQTHDLSLLKGLEVLLRLPAPAHPGGLSLPDAPLFTWLVLDFTRLPDADTALAAHAAEWKNFLANQPALLHLDLPAERLHTVLDALLPAGLVLEGGEEERVGVKSYDEIDAVFEQLGID